VGTKRERERRDLSQGAVLGRAVARDESGFTLVEILVTLTIIAILVAIAVPSYLGYQRKATETTAESNLRAALPAVEAYYHDNATYASMTITALAANYDQGISADVHVLSASDTTYCIRSTHGAVSFFKNGPGATVTTTACV
jgi:type IV pilus assembly protein PilA